MSLFLAKYPTLLKLLYPKRISTLPGNSCLYLSFDDGPIPEVTPWVLELLEQYAAKATFFCIGQNVEKNPEIFKEIIERGHCIGNHTYHHLNGWKTGTACYLENVSKTQEIFYKNDFSPQVLLFRPPYGKIKNSQAANLAKIGYKIVMWDVISGDYDHNFSAEKCFQHVIRNVNPGSTIVFHDSLKAKENLQETLPRVLQHYHNKGFTFKGIIDAL